MRKLILLVAFIAYTLCGKVFAQVSKYESFKTELKSQVEGLKKLPKKQIISQLSKTKSDIDKNIAHYEKLSEKDSIELDSENRKALEQFQYLNIIFEPTWVLMQQKTQNKKSCTAAKNKTEIEGTLKDPAEAKPSEEAEFALSIIKAICPNNL